MPKLIEPSERRVTITMRVAPATKAWLKSQNESQSQLIDKAVALLMKTRK